MTDYLLQPIQQRVIDVVCNGRGASGSLGTTAQQRSIAAGQFRWSDAPLRDGSLAGSAFHRAVNLDWRTDVDLKNPGNDAEVVSIQQFTFALEVGYTHSAVSDLVHPVTAGETKLTVAKNATAVALSDAWRIRRALMCSDITQGNPTLDPDLLDIYRVSDSHNERLQGGRMICTTLYLVRVQTTNATAYTP